MGIPKPVPLIHYEKRNHVPIQLLLKTLESPKSPGINFKVLIQRFEAEGNIPTMNK